MDNLDNRVDQPDSPAPAPAQNKPEPAQPSWIEDLILNVLVFLAFLTVKPTKWLFNGTYKRTVGEGEYAYTRANSLNITIGALIALAAGIGVGYNLGFVGDASLLTWLGTGIATTAAMFVYGYTLLYQLALKRAFKVSEKLWSWVNIDAEEVRRPYRMSDEEWAKVRKNPAWFSQLLMFLSWLSLGLGGLSLVYNVACYIQAHQSGWAWLGVGVGALTCLALVCVAIAILVGAAKMSGKFAVFLVLAFIGLMWVFDGFRALVASIFLGPYNALTGSDWGSWGYFPGAVGGIVLAAIVCVSLGFLLYNARLRMLAAVSGIAATFAFAPVSDALVSTIPLGPFAFLEPALAWLAYGLELLLFIGFAFPVLHIAITHGLKKLANILDLMEDVYQERRGGFRELFAQVTNIALVGLFVWFVAPALVTAYLGWTSIWAVYGLTALTGFVLYVVLGHLLAFTGCWPAAVAASAYVGLTASQLYSKHLSYFGAVGTWGSGIATGALMFVVIWPLLYSGLRWLAYRGPVIGLRNGLVRAHERVWKGLGELWDNLFEAAEKTYEDRTPYREVFVHGANILVSLAVLGGVAYGFYWLNVALWLGVLVGAVLALSSYLLFGRYLVKEGAGPIGFLVAVGLGVYFGTLVHGAQPATWGAWRYILSVGGWLLSAWIVYALAFPWAYLVLRFLVNIVSPENWLRPLLIAMHEGLWKRFAAFWAAFMVKYRRAEERFARARERFDQMYARFSERFNDRMNKGGK